MLARAPAGRPGTVHAEPDDVVVIDLEVAEPVIAQQVDDFLRKVIQREGIAEIPESPGAYL